MEPLRQSDDSIHHASDLDEAAAASTVAAVRLQDTELEPTLQQSGKRWSRHLRDLHILSLSFLSVFLAYGATQNLESSLDTKRGLGSVALGVLYLSLTVSSLGAPILVIWLGSKHAILIGLSGYWAFMAGNLYPNWYTMVSASIYLGFTAALLWVAEGTYITLAAKFHASACDLPEESVIGNFNGEFWGVFACNQVLGNLLSLTILQFEKGSETGKTEAFPGTTLLFIVFLGCMTLGTGLACFLSPQTDILKLSLEKEALLQKHAKNDFVRATFALLQEKKMLSLIPLLIYTGLQQAFAWGDFTKDIITPAVGLSFVGGVMAAYGVADAACSLVAGRFSTGLVSISWIIFGGAFAQILVIVRLFLKHRFGNDLTGYLNLFGMAIVWGLGDGAFNTQISALLGILYPHDAETAFAQWKIWQSIATSAAFFATSDSVLAVSLIVLLVTLSISLLSFSWVIFLPERFRMAKY